jgi:hypothetical protein
MTQRAATQILSDDLRTEVRELSLVLVWRRWADALNLAFFDPCVANGVLPSRSLRQGAVCNPAGRIRAMTARSLTSVPADLELEEVNDLGLAQLKRRERKKAKQEDEQQTIETDETEQASDE